MVHNRDNTTMDAPSAQLHSDLRNAVIRSLSNRRPLLHHLNADTSWLLQLPRPISATKHSGRQYYNVLIDPWLTGGQSDVASWFSHQWHAEPSVAQSVVQIEELARELDILAGELRLGQGRTPNRLGNAGDTTSFIDLVAISHEFTDHCHKETMLDIHRDVPVIATEKAAALIRSWSHFRTVLTTPVFDRESSDWRILSMPPLPAWLSISRVVSGNETFLQFHSALLIAFDPCIMGDYTRSDHDTRHSGSRQSLNRNGSSYPDGDVAEAILYTPHGIPADSPGLNSLPHALPRINILAFLHGLHDITNGPQQLNLGANNGLRAQRLLNAKYWVSTHDEVKKQRGLVSWFLKRNKLTVEEAVAAERERGKWGGERDRVCFEEIRNGESRVLL